MKFQFILFIIILFSSCKENEVDPRQKILGKWETFYVGNGEYQPPIKHPTGYSEYLPDSVLLEYDYTTKKTLIRRYWIDSLLHKSSQREDGVWISFDFDVQFNADTMRLERKNIFATFYISKDRRIK